MNPLALGGNMRWLIIVILWCPLWPKRSQCREASLGSTGRWLSGSLGLNAAFTSGNILFADFGTTSHLEWRKNKDLIFWVLNARFAAKRLEKPTSWPNPTSIYGTKKPTLPT